MKTSNKILVIAVALAAAVVILGIVGLRLYLDKVIDEGGGKFSQESIIGSGNRVERKYDVKDFSNIQISGVWYAEIYRGDEYSVEIAGP